MSALVPERNGVRLVVFAADSVGVRYRMGATAWHPLAVRDGIGSTALDGDFGADAVDVEITYAGSTTVSPVDAFTELR